MCHGYIIYGCNKIKKGTYPQLRKQKKKPNPSLHQLQRVNSKASTIKQTAQCDFNTLPLSPAKYNDTWQKRGNNSHHQHWEGETEGFNACSSPAV